MNTRFDVYTGNRIVMNCAAPWEQNDVQIKTEGIKEMGRELYRDLSEAYKEKQANLFYQLEKQTEVGKKKNWSLIFVGLTILLLAVISYFDFFDIKNYKLKTIINLELGNLVILIVIFLLTLVIYNISVYKMKINQIKKINELYTALPKHRGKYYLLKRFLLPDYTYAKESKEHIINNAFKKNSVNEYKPKIYNLKSESSEEISNYHWLRIQIEMKFLVERLNWINIYWTVMLFFVVVGWYLLVSIFFDINQLKIVDYIWFTFACFLAIRIFSRGIEIVIAFYKDVVRVDGKMFYVKYRDEMSLDDKINNSTYYNGFKYTLLRSQGRLSLAIHTLIEVCILFSTIYIILSIYITDFWGENTLATPITSVLYSFSISMFNVSLDNNFNILQNFLHAVQVFISGVLILLAVSQYLNGKNDLKEGTFEYSFYKAVEIERKKENELWSPEFYKETLGKKTIFYGNGIEVIKISKCHHVYKNKDNKKELRIKLKRKCFIRKEYLKIEPSCLFNIKVEGKNKIYITYNE